MERPPAWRRLAAFGVDYLLIAAWMGAIAAVSIAAGATEAPSIESGGRVLRHLLASATLTLPVLLYFALTEAGAGATLGKRLLRLRVRRLGGGPLGLPRSLLRSAVKLAPWEVAHVGLWYGPGRPMLDPPTGVSLVVLTVANLMALAWAAGLLTPSGRTVYDRLSGARVTAL